MHKLLLILHTIWYIKPIQIRYQLWYRIRRFWRKRIGFKYPMLLIRDGVPLKLIQVTPKKESFNHYQFSFLNQSTTFSEKTIDWDYPDYGRLWTYNLNYFDFLLQPGLNQKTGITLINNFILKLEINSTALEPYPIALRGINWIKFFSMFDIRHSTFDNSLYAQYKILCNNLEYHLLANHLLEDGFSLLFGAYYFKEKTFYKKANKIIVAELEEQILDDGAHFELSPMYHQIILDRLLDCINLLQNNRCFANQQELLDKMIEKAGKMLYWLNAITFSNGDIPLFNDAAPNIAPTTRQLNRYAANLNISLENETPDPGPRNPELSFSGYKKFAGINYECILDVGEIVPSYQPGHAHADTFNFVLNIKNFPFIVDTGISTYEANNTRLVERGTAAHNTVTVQRKNSSEVWSSFRVARRASVKIIKESDQGISAEHNGYRMLNTTHQREWNFTESAIEITDTLTGKIREGKAHFLFSPVLLPLKQGNRVSTGDAIFEFENAEEIQITPVKIPNGYNIFVETHKLEIQFKGHLTTQITIN
jgi:hypothetical protein